VCARLAENLDAIWGQEQTRGLFTENTAASSQLFRAVLPPILSLELSMIAHLQSTLIRTDPVTRAIKGLLFRDHSSLFIGLTSKTTAKNENLSVLSQLVSNS
jgi:uncharacterized BrkB/YihY/UPF0761 family membrane protein